MEELIKHANGQWDIVEKSGYGPKVKGTSLYNQADNSRRKANNTGDILPSSTNTNVKTYTNNVRGTASQQANKEAVVARKKSKAMPVKTFSPEEKAALESKMGIKKEELKLSTNGQWNLC